MKINRAVTVSGFVFVRDSSKGCFFFAFTEDLNRHYWVRDPDRAALFLTESEALLCRDGLIGDGRRGRTPFQRLLSKTYLVGHRVKRLGGAGRLWTPEEVSCLRKRAGTLSPQALALALGRTVSSVKHKCKKLGLRRAKRHELTAVQVQMIKQHKKGSSRKPLADATGLTVEQVGSLIARFRKRARNGSSGFGAAARV